MQFKKHEPSKLDLAIESVYADMAGFTSDADEYATMVDQLTKLHALKDKPRVQPDTLVSAGAQLLSVLIIVNHERAHILASKALMFIRGIR